MNLLALNAILAGCHFRDWIFYIGQIGEGFYLQVIFTADDHDSGAAARRQSGRKWYVSAHATSGEVVQTALKAVLTAVEHEAREEFRYKGQAIFGPHLDVDALVGIADRTVRRA